MVKWAHFPTTTKIQIDWWTKWTRTNAWRTISNASFMYHIISFLDQYSHICINIINKFAVADWSHYSYNTWNRRQITNVVDMVLGLWGFHELWTDYRRVGDQKYWKTSSANNVSLKHAKMVGKLTWDWWQECIRHHIQRYIGFPSDQLPNHLAEQLIPHCMYKQCFGWL